MLSEHFSHTGIVLCVDVHRRPELPSFDELRDTRDHNSVKRRKKKPCSLTSQSQKIPRMVSVRCPVARPSTLKTHNNLWKQRGLSNPKWLIDILLTQNRVELPTIVRIHPHYSMREWTARTVSKHYICEHGPP